MDPTFNERDALNLFAKTLEGDYIHIDCGRKNKIPMENVYNSPNFDKKRRLRKLSVLREEK
jgi:hypothetical protein